MIEAAGVVAAVATGATGATSAGATGASTGVSTASTGALTFTSAAGSYVDSTETSVSDLFSDETSIFTLMASSFAYKKAVALF